MSFILPSKLPQYLVRAVAMFNLRGRTDLRDAITASRFYVRQEAEYYENWGNGVSAHDVVLFLPIEQITRIDNEGTDETAKEICDALNQMAKAINAETFREVSFELADDEDAEFREARRFSQRPEVDGDTLDFWKPGLVRLFISHRDKHKVEARQLGDALEDYGLSSFVAHDTIKPMKEWRSEILNGLETMDAMLAFVTDDFKDSDWCQQEVGYALGRGVPVLCLKLGQAAPPAFLSNLQGLPGKLASTTEAAASIFGLVASQLGNGERMTNALIESMLASPSYADTNTRFDRLRASTKKLTEEQLQKIIDGYSRNSQVFKAAYLNNQNERLVSWLHSATGRRFEIDGRKINELKITSPFGDKPF